MVVRDLGSDSSVRNTCALRSISSCSSLRMRRDALGAVPTVAQAARSVLAHERGRVGGQGRERSRLAYSTALLPARLPNTLMSSSELVPRRLAPCTDTQAHSPAA